MRQSKQEPGSRNNQNDNIQLIDLGSTAFQQKAGTAFASNRKQKEKPAQIF